MICDGRNWPIKVCVQFLFEPLTECHILYKGILFKKLMAYLVAFIYAVKIYLRKQGILPIRTENLDLFKKETQCAKPINSTAPDVNWFD